jgi:hypothetical protein
VSNTSSVEYTLHEVERVHAEVGAGPVVPGQEVLAGVVLRRLLDAAAHLRGHRDARVAALAEELADQRLAAAVAVDVRGVEEVHPGVRGGVQHGQRVGLLDLTPVRAKLPAAETHDTDLAAQLARVPVLHDPNPR